MLICFFPSGNILDLVFTTDDDRVCDISSQPPLPGSHHCPVVFSVVFQSSTEILEDCPSSKFAWSKGRYTAMSDELSEVDWELAFFDLTADECYTIFLDILYELILKHVPKLKPSNKQEWLSKPPRELKRRRAEAWTCYKLTREQLGRHHLQTTEALNRFKIINVTYRRFASTKQAEYELKISKLLAVAPKIFHSYIRRKKKVARVLVL